MLHIDVNNEALGSIDEIGAITCYKCHGIFCINCRVPWHTNMNCEEYKRRNPTPIVEESKLKNLAARNLWRQCIKCKHMIELVAGCYHMTCMYIILISSCASST
ncbi:putative IBR domain, E3 ubiquitin ligase RBR family [Helianthus annuus]|nr:putative IBR domain, E3 ubiquitin ligase RBR family [Helianthus annuus]KAJ0760308.1 putative IBR domain, E3 ubiquitin ligase RBR family [Helianthus annuus]KAJ0930097.1 putative IBR domain, E3 ubiquitin ligase RBR family [Helianthus annuus]